jgi:maltose alpha-D-glucosyltransferase / alpha-amylase
MLKLFTTCTGIDRRSTLDVGVKEGNRLINLLVGEHSDAGPDGKHKIVLDGYGYYWYRVGSLRHILKREKY